VSATGQRPSVSGRRTSTFGARRPAPDEEEGEASADQTLVDLEEYLQNRSRERGKEAGIIPKKVGVSFRDLAVSGFAGAGWIMIETFPKKLLSLFGWGFVGFARMALAPAPQPRPIIQGFSGVVRPGEMLLVLGKPGSGASTFLRALTNQPRAFTRIDGEINYAGLPFELARGQFRGEILYNGEGGLLRGGFSR